MIKIHFGSFDNNQILFSGLNANLRYSIKLNDDTMVHDNGIFAVGAESGKLYTTGNLDRERQDKFNVTIKVHDQGDPSLLNEKQFNITVTDENDNSPIFTGKPYFKVIKETQTPGTEVIKVSVDGPLY